MVVAVGDGDIGIVKVRALFAVSDEPAHQIDGMDCLVDDGAAAFHVPCSLPVAARIILWRTAPRHIAFRRLDGAETTAVKAVLDKQRTWIVAVLENDAERLASLLGGVDHCLRLLH